MPTLTIRQRRVHRSVGGLLTAVAPRYRPGSSTLRQVTHPSSFSNSLMSATTGVKPRSSRSSAVRGADAAISTWSRPAGRHGSRPARPQGGPPGTARLAPAGQQQERAVRQRGHRRLQVQHVPSGTAITVRPSGPAARAAGDARAVGPAAAPHVHDVAACSTSPPSRVPARGSRRCAGPATG